MRVYVSMGSMVAAWRLNESVSGEEGVRSAGV